MQLLRLSDWDFSKPQEDGVAKSRIPTNKDLQDLGAICDHTVDFWEDFVTSITEKVLPKYIIYPRYWYKKKMPICDWTEMELTWKWC